MPMRNSLPSWQRQKSFILVIVLLFASLLGTLLLANYHRNALNTFAQRGQDNVDWAYFSVERGYFPIKQTMDTFHAEFMEGVLPKSFAATRWPDAPKTIEAQYYVFASAVDNLKGRSFNYILDYKSARTAEEPMLDSIKTHYMYLLAYTRHLDTIIERNGTLEGEGLTYMMDHNNEVNEHVRMLSTLANQKLSQYLSDRQDQLIRMEQYVMYMLFLLAASVMMFAGLVLHYVHKLAKASLQLEQSNENLMQARDEVLEAFQSKSMFVAKMSHEVRTPLNSIIGFGQLLESDENHPLNAAQKENLSYIMRSANHLMLLINEILDYSKLEAGKISINRDHISMRAVIEDVRYILKKELQINRNELVIHCPSDIWVHADVLRFKQVLINIVSNAIKYGYKGVPINVHVTLKDDKQVLVAVRNEGETIHPDIMKQLFNPYFRGSHEMSSIHGYGIGLNLSKRLMEMMEGDITCESFNNHTTFYLNINGGIRQEQELLRKEMEQNAVIKESVHLMMVTSHQRYIDQIRALVQDTHIELIIVPDSAYATDILNYMPVPVVLYTREILTPTWTQFLLDQSIQGYLLDLDSPTDNTVGLEQVKLIIEELLSR